MKGRNPMDKGSLACRAGGGHSPSFAEHSFRQIVQAPVGQAHQFSTTWAQGPRAAAGTRDRRGARICRPTPPQLGCDSRRYQGGNCGVGGMHAVKRWNGRAGMSFDLWRRRSLLNYRLWECRSAGAKINTEARSFSCRLRSAICRYWRAPVSCR